MKKRIDCNLKKNYNNPKCASKFNKQIGEAEFKIIIPKKDNSGRPIKLPILKKYIGKVNKVFGGSTTIPTTKGCYIDKGKLQCEESFQITAVRDFDSKYAPELKKLTPSQRTKKLKEDYDKLRKIASQAGKQLGQDSIMIVSDSINDASFVRGKWRKSIRKSKTGRKVLFD